MTEPTFEPPTKRSAGTTAFFACLLGLALYWFGYLLWDFATDMVLGFLIAGGARSYYLKLLPKLSGRSGLAAAIVTLAVAVIIALPALWLVTSLSRQAASAYAAVQVALADASVQEAMRGEGWVGRHAESLGKLVGFQYRPETFRQSIADAAGNVAGFLSLRLNSVLANVLSALYHFALMLVVVFFGLVDGPAIKRHIFDLSPLPDDEEERIVITFRNVGGAILLGNGVGSVLQGALGGIALWVAGVPSPLFWGAVMCVFAFLPLIGLHAVSLPATLYLMLLGRFPAAIAFLAVLSARERTHRKPRQTALDGQPHADARYADLLRRARRHLVVRSARAPVRAADRRVFSHHRGPVRRHVSRAPVRQEPVNERRS